MPSTAVAHLLDIAKSLKKPWQPAPALTVNGATLRVVKFEGHFSGFHKHDVDECYVLLDGEMLVEIQDDAATRLVKGDAFVVRAGTVHRPFALPHATVLLIT